MRTALAAARPRRVGALALALLGLDVSAAPAAAATPLLADAIGLTSRAALFLTGIFVELISDRTRLIQASVFIVALGIALLWWRK